MSSYSKGQYYVTKSLKYMSHRGYDVTRVDAQTTDWRGGGCLLGRPIENRTDLWGADLIAKNTQHTVFIQVKKGRKTKAGGIIADKAGPLQAFQQGGPWPMSSECWLMVWAARVPDPLVVVFTHEELNERYWAMQAADRRDGSSG